MPPPGWIPAGVATAAGIVLMVGGQLEVGAFAVVAGLLAALAIQWQQRRRKG